MPDTTTPEPLGWMVLYRNRPDAPWRAGQVGLIHTDPEKAERHRRTAAERQFSDVLLAVLYPATTQEPTPAVEKREDDGGLPYGWPPQDRDIWYDRIRAEDWTVGTGVNGLEFRRTEATIPIADVPNPDRMCLKSRVKLNGAHGPCACLTENRPCDCWDNDEEPTA